MKIALTERRNAEIVHHADPDLLVESKFNRVRVSRDGEVRTFRLPLKLHWRVIGMVRIARRFFRLDKCSIAVSGDRKSMAISHQGKLYRYDLETNTLEQTGSLTQSRTALHMAIAAPGDDCFLIGEYGRNPEGRSVPIHGSYDGGRSWRRVFEFPPGQARHIHGVYRDPFSDHIWVTTGDFEGECHVVRFDGPKLNNPKFYGDGSQTSRTVALFFAPENIYWIMDSNLERSHLVRMSRETGEMAILDPFPGPVWYAKSLSDGTYLAQTTCERGAGVLTNRAHVFLSKDLENWQEVCSFEHDGWPLGIFKNAVISFATGEQSSRRFYMSMEAIKGMDGRSYECGTDE